MHSFTLPLIALLVSGVDSQLGMAPMHPPPVPNYLTNPGGAPLRGGVASPPNQGLSTPSSSSAGASSTTTPSLFSSGSSWLKYFRSYTVDNFPMAVFLFCVIFVIKHTLCIPGGTLLNAIGGALFGVVFSIPLCLVLSVIGGSGAYMLSLTCGAPLLARWRLEGRLLPLKRRVDAATAKGSLFRMLVSLRMLPLFPQWLVNLGAPHVGIPLALFIPTTGLGLIPYVCVTTTAGSALSNVLEGSDVSTIIPPQTIVALCLCAAAVGLGPFLASKVCGVVGGGGGGDASSESGVLEAGGV